MGVVCVGVGVGCGWVWCVWMGVGVECVGGMCVCVVVRVVGNGRVLYIYHHSGVFCTCSMCWRRS